MNESTAMLQAEEKSIDQEIVRELVSITPSSWRRIICDVKFEKDSYSEKFDHCIFSPEGLPDLVEPSDAIYDATFRLQQLFRKYGGEWKTVRYDVTVDEYKRIKYSVAFDEHISIAVAQKSDTG